MTKAFKNPKPPLTVADLEARMESAVSLTQRIIDVDAEVGTRDRWERLAGLAGSLASELTGVSHAVHDVAAFARSQVRSQHESEPADEADDA